MHLAHADLVSIKFVIGYHHHHNFCYCPYYRYLQLNLLIQTLIQTGIYMTSL